MTDGPLTATFTSRHALLAEAFELFAQSIGPMMDERMGAYLDDEPVWTEAAAHRMGRGNEHGTADPLFQLLVMRRFWGPVFAEYFGADLRPLVAELIDARNLWAHLNLPDDPAFLDQTMLAMERIIAPVTTDHMLALRRIRAALLNPTPTAQDETATPPGTEEQALLLCQLNESAAAFSELQENHERLQSELSASRKVAARKQLRLSQLEGHLADVIDRTQALEANLQHEQATRGRIEWLFVGFLAALLFAMAVAGGF